MSRVANIGVVGLGAFMARQHLPNMMRNPGIKIHTICDTDAALLARRTEELRPEHSTTVAEELFSNPEIDTVLVGTRSDLHCHFVLEAAKHGKHVFVEKPMTMSYAETARALAAVKAAGIKVGVGFNRRFAPIMLEAKRLFGESRQGAANIVYRIVDDHRVRPHYIFDMDKGGGHLLQEGCHIFDLLAWFLGSEPVEIYAVGALETDNTIVIKYADGSTAALVCGGKGGGLLPQGADGGVLRRRHPSPWTSSMSCAATGRPGISCGHSPSTRSPNWLRGPTT